MTTQEAYRALGLTAGATMAEIKAAYLTQAKLHHPDRNGGGSAATHAFQEVQAAYETLIGRKPAGVIRAERPGSNGTHADEGAAPDDLDAVDPVLFARSFMAERGITILFDDTIRVASAPRAGYGPNDQAAWLARQADWTIAELLDEMMLAVCREGIALSSGDVRRALTRIVREDRKDRANFLMRPLIWDRLDAAEAARAQAAWEGLVGTVLDIARPLGIAVLQHFIWQVKRKQLNLPVEHHLMPVIVSRLQGTGKTTFVRRFLGPLAELATDPVPLTDLADARSGDVFRYLVVSVDDIERLPAAYVERLKSVLTGTASRGRRLGTSLTDKRTQCATMIGTANEAISTLIPDPTGHRRFAELPFRNGAVAKGGDGAVWPIVESTDYDLLWRSVDGFGPTPIQPHLEALAALQRASAPPDPLRAWLVALDLDSDKIAAITIRGGVRSDDLRLLFCAEMGEPLSANRFAERMAVLVGNPAVPFKPKVRVPDAVVYPRKHPRRPAESAASP